MANNSFLSSVDFRRPWGRVSMGGRSSEWQPGSSLLRECMPMRGGNLWNPQTPGPTSRHKVWALLRAKSFLGKRQTTLEEKLLEVLCASAPQENVLHLLEKRVRIEFHAMGMDGHGRGHFLQSPCNDFSLLLSSVECSFRFKAEDMLLLFNSIALLKLCSYWTPVPHRLPQPLDPPFFRDNKCILSLLAVWVSNCQNTAPSTFKCVHFISLNAHFNTKEKKGTHNEAWALRYDALARIFRGKHTEVCNFF